MEIGAQVLAPLALALGLAEVAGKSIVTRFAARLLADRAGNRGPDRLRHRPAQRRGLHQGLAGDHGLLPDRPQQAARVRAGSGRRDRRADRDRDDRRPAGPRPGVAGCRPGHRGRGRGGAPARGARHRRGAGTVGADGLAVHAAVRAGRGGDLARRAAGSAGRRFDLLHQEAPAGDCRRGVGPAAVRDGGPDATGDFEPGGRRRVRHLPQRLAPGARRSGLPGRVRVTTRDIRARQDYDVEAAGYPDEAGYATEAARRYHGRTRRGLPDRAGYPEKPGDAQAGPPGTATGPGTRPDRAAAPRPPAGGSRSCSGRSRSTRCSRTGWTISTG